MSIQTEKGHANLLTVKDLIEQLQKFDQDLPVISYNSGDEGSEIVSGVSLQTEENQHYCNGDHPFFYNDYLETHGMKAVCIEASPYC